MSGPSSHPAEQRLAAAVRGGLAERPAPADLAAVARRRVDREQGRTRVIALAAMVGAILLAALLASLVGRGEEAAVPDGDSLDGAALLTTADVGRHVPGVAVSTPAADVSPIGIRAGPATIAVFGGWCGDATLVGAQEPEQAWAAEWLQEGSGGPGPDGGARQVVLRWPAPGGPESADTYVRALAATPLECRDPRGAPYPLTTYVAQPSAGGSVGSGGPVGSGSGLAVAALNNGAVTAETAAGAEYGHPSGFVGVDRRLPAWRVRAVRAQDDTVVDLTVVLRSTSARGAGAEAEELLDEAMLRATGDEPGS